LKKLGDVAGLLQQYPFFDKKPAKTIEYQPVKIA
jgi:hypothetical protein